MKIQATHKSLDEAERLLAKKRGFEILLHDIFDKPPIVWNEPRIYGNAKDGWRLEQHGRVEQ